MARRSATANPRAYVGFPGTVKSYDPATNTVVVYYSHVDDQQTETPAIPLYTPFAGNGYGMQGGVEEGTPVTVLQLNPDGDDVVAMACSYNEANPAPGAPATEHWTTDKRGSSVKLTADGNTDGDGQGGAKLVGAGYASVVAPLFEAGAENLDPIPRAAAANADIQAYHSWLVSTILTPLAAILQGGEGVPLPPGTPPNLGSQTVRVAP